MFSVEYSAVAAIELFRNLVCNSEKQAVKIVQGPSVLYPHFSASPGSFPDRMSHMFHSCGLISRHKPSAEERLAGFFRENNFLFGSLSFALEIPGFFAVLQAFSIAIYITCHKSKQIKKRPE